MAGTLGSHDWVRLEGKVIQEAWPEGSYGLRLDFTDGTGVVLSAEAVYNLDGDAVPVLSAERKGGW